MGQGDWNSCVCCVCVCVCVCVCGGGVGSVRGLHRLSANRTPGLVLASCHRAMIWLYTKDFACVDVLEYIRSRGLSDSSSATRTGGHRL